MLSILGDESELRLGYSTEGVKLWDEREELGTPLMEIFFNNYAKKTADSSSAQWYLGFYTIEDFENHVGTGRIASLCGSEIDVTQGDFLGAGIAEPATFERMFVTVDPLDFWVDRAMSGSLVKGHFTGTCYLFGFDASEEAKANVHRLFDLPQKSVQRLDLNAGGTVKLSEISYKTEADGMPWDLFADASNNYYFDTTNTANPQLCVRMDMGAEAGIVSYASYPLKGGETTEFFPLTNEEIFWK